MITPEASILDVSRKLSLLTKELGLLDTIKDKLLKNPDRAAAQLAIVMEELLKSMLAFEAEVVKFLSLAFDPRTDSGSNRSLLHSLEGQSLSARINEARGHCHKIASIYKAYLNPWFQRVAGLDKAERKALRQLFYGLSESDSLMVDSLNAAASWLADEAKLVLNFLERDDTEGANTRIAQARLCILPVRFAVANTMKKLRELEADFIEKSGIP